MSREHAVGAGTRVGANAAADADALPGRQTLAEPHAPADRKADDENAFGAGQWEAIEPDAGAEPAARPTAVGRGGGDARPASGGGARTGAGAATGGIRVVTTSVARDNASRSRTKVGVGEEVTFSVPGATGAWAATRQFSGSSVVEGGRSSFVWRAPDSPGAATITHTPDGGGAPKTVDMDVVAPTAVDFLYAADTQQAPAGAGMVNYLEIGPYDVSFEGAMWKEQGGSAAHPKGVRGYFERFIAQGGDLYHYPATQWFRMNGMLKDEAAIGGLPPMGGANTWSDGSFYWDIPNLYSVEGRGAGTKFATVRQEFSIKANGEVTVKKGGSTVTKMPGPAASAVSSTPQEIADYKKLLDNEGLELMLQRMRAAPDNETKRVIREVIEARTPPPTVRIGVRCTNSYSWFTKDNISIDVNGQPTSRGAFQIDTNGEELTTIKFTDAFSLNRLAGSYANPTADIRINVEGHSFDVSISNVFGTTEYATVGGSENRYQVKYELQNAGSKVVAPTD